MELNINTERILEWVKTESPFVDLAQRTSQFKLARNLLNVKGNHFQKFRSLHRIQSLVFFFTCLGILKCLCIVCAV